MRRTLAGILSLLFIIAPALAQSRYRRLDGPAQWGRSRTFDVQHIKLELSFDEERRTVLGRATTTLQPLADNFTAVELDAVDLNIENVNLADGRALEFQSYADRLIVRLDRPYNSRENITFTVAYRCQPKSGLFFIAPDERYPNRPRQIWTQGEMEDNRRWFPGFDYPNDRATSEVILTVKDNYTAISNGRLVGVRNDKPGLKTFHWKEEKPHAAYLIAFVVGEYVELKEKFEDIPVSYFVYKSNAADAPRSFSKTVPMMKFFSERVGYRYPFEKYAQTIVADFTFGGMENISATTLTDDTIHPESVHAEMSSDGLVAHELAHQWYGDLITCRDWSQLWLNEGFATFFASVWKEHDLGKAEYLMDMIGHTQRYTDEEEQKYRRPIVFNRYLEPDLMFDRHTYQKGALVLNMLRWLLGEERFWRGIHHYTRKFEYQNVDTNDFKVAMEEATGESLGWFFDEWVYKAGYPEFDATLNWDERQKLVHLAVKQTQQLDTQTPIFRTPVDIEITTASGARLYRVDITGTEQEFQLPADSRPLMVRFDKTGAIIKKLNFHRPKDMILYQLEHDSEAWGRIEAARELKAFVADETVIAALGRALKSDKFWGVRAETARSLGAGQFDSARDALIAGYSDEHFNVRAAVVEGLTGRRDARSQELLEQALKNDRSVTVVAAAAKIIGKNGGPRAFNLLAETLNRDSYRETVRAGAIEGLKELKDARALPLVMKWAEYGSPRRLREAAINALSALGKGNAEVTQFLVALLEDPTYTVRRSTIEVMKDLKDFKTVEPLGRRLMAEPDGRLRLLIRDAMAQMKN